MLTNSNIQISVTDSGAILLGDDFSCDGRHVDAKYRAQSHLHQDHMQGFERDKSKDIFLTEGSWELLCAEQPNFDIPVRINIYKTPFDEYVALNGKRFMFKDNKHMLGSAQIMLETEEGLRLGYSGDFSWPLDDVISVDQLVVDSTYGNPRNDQPHSRTDVDLAFRELVLGLIPRGPVLIKAVRGTVERALSVLADLNVPVICPNDYISILAVYQGHGVAFPRIVGETDAEFNEIRRDNRYIMFVNSPRMTPEPNFSGATIFLSGFIASKNKIIHEYRPNKSYSVPMTNHAGHEDIIEYVCQAGASFVITDGSRGGSPNELAIAIKERLRIEATPSTA